MRADYCRRRPFVSPAAVGATGLWVEQQQYRRVLAKACERAPRVS
jgi:hypothetical protein